MGPCNAGVLESFSVVALAGYLSCNLGGSKAAHAMTNTPYFLHLLIFNSSFQSM